MLRMPTIRIDAEVFAGLQRLAEPLVDTPGAVIRRLLVEKGVLASSNAPAKARATLPAAPTPAAVAAPAALTPQPVYEQYLLHTLARDFDGRGDKRSVTQAVIQHMVSQGYIGPADLELVATGETRAENTIVWGRNALKNRGLIARGGRRGVWELTEAGLAGAAALVLPRPARR
jgi:hypothetical protein